MPQTERVDVTRVQVGLLEQCYLGRFLEVFSGSTITLKTYHMSGTCVPPLMFTKTGDKFYPHFTQKGVLREVTFPNFYCFLCSAS